MNGSDVRGLPIKDVVDLIKGIPETTVELLMGRRVDAWMSPPTEQARPQNPQKIQDPPQPPPTVQAQPQLPPAPAPPPPAPPSPAVQEQPTSPLQTREVVVQPRTLSPSPAPKEYTPAPPDPPPRNETAPPLPQEVTLPSPPSPPKPTPAAPPPASQAPPAPAPQPMQAPTPDNKQNGFVVKNWPDGKQYRGEMLEGKRHGKGSIIYPDGASYDGDWHNDWRHGHGEYKYTDGTWYKGQWEMGNRQGEGLCTYADGNMFQGSWVANLPHGKGQCRFAEGSLYRGEFVMGKMHGTGTLIRRDGTIEFEGEWRDGEPCPAALHSSRGFASASQPMAVLKGMLNARFHRDDSWTPPHPPESACKASFCRPLQSARARLQTHAPPKPRKIACEWTCTTCGSVNEKTSPRLCEICGEETLEDDFFEIGHIIPPTWKQGVHYEVKDSDRFEANEICVMKRSDGTWRFAKILKIASKMKEAHACRVAVGTVKRGILGYNIGKIIHQSSRDEKSMPNKSNSQMSGSEFPDVLTPWNSPVIHPGAVTAVVDTFFSKRRSSLVNCAISFKVLFSAHTKKRKSHLSHL